MISFNKVFLIGNLTRDPELRYTPSGVPVASMRLAINTQFRDKSGERKIETCYVNIVAWNRQAELCSQFLSKGRRVLVEGRLQSRSWETSDGTKRSIIEVRADRIQFLDGRRQESPLSSTSFAGVGDEETSDVRFDDDFVNAIDDLDDIGPTDENDLPF